MSRLDVLHRLILRRFANINRYNNFMPWRCYSKSKDHLQPTTSKPQSVSYLKSKGEKIDVWKIRNIGIIAHIDAGKTTTTERMLYYCGFINAMGDVDSGSTVTDYMEQERERGITITSAAITFYFDKHRLNLIDTPGHVDFTLEVERSLRVLDGAVTILDASAGVEAQTVVVWRQARRFGIPSIIYLNKMDKPNSNVEMCINSIKEKLNIEPVLLQIPLGRGKSFRGVVDLIRMELLEWPNDGDGKVYKRSSISASSSRYDEMQNHRRSLIEKVSEHDDQLAESILSRDSSNMEDYYRVSPVDLVNALRRATLARRLAPTLCGASLRNKGVQPLLESICSYLPSPNQRDHAFLRFYSQVSEGCQGGAYRGEAVDARFSWQLARDSLKRMLTNRSTVDMGNMTGSVAECGKLVPGMKIYNATRDVTETLQRIYVPHSDEMEDVDVVDAGNIAVVPNLKQTFTGDTIVESEMSARKAAEAYAKEQKKVAKDKTEIASTSSVDEIDTSTYGKLVLAGIQAPEPVFFCTIEPPSYGQQEQFEQALKALAREDPSVRFREDPENQQIILQGMGQLHIEIIKDRLLKEYKLDVFLGPLQINYREAIFNSAEAYHTLSETVVKEQKKERYEITVGLRVEPGTPGSGTLRKLRLRHMIGENYLLALPSAYMDAAFEACTHTLANGPLLGRQVVDVEVVLLDLLTNRRCPSTLVGACVSLCLTEALKKAGCQLFEPIVYLETTIPESYFTIINGELLRRRAEILETKSNLDEKTRTVFANVPLAKMVDFNAVLRRLTSGSGFMHMEVKEYGLVPPDEVNKIVGQVTGVGDKQ